MEERLLQNARAYASQFRLQLAERLGFGVHGIVLVTENNAQAGKTAIKVHRAREAFRRERGVYERLHEAGIIEILGFNVPQMIRSDNRLLVIEMTVVERPFLLDFAGAYLDAPLEFPEEIWAEWEAEKIEQFGARWPRVLEVLAKLEHYDIYMLDVSPSNIAFRD
jgi:hypothetical protein